MNYVRNNRDKIDQSHLINTFFRVYATNYTLTVTALFSNTSATESTTTDTPGELILQT